MQKLLSDFHETWYTIMDYCYGKNLFNFGIDPIHKWSDGSHFGFLL